nr:hypothetical protein [Tanacetum cinerariifolium]
MDTIIDQQVAMDEALVPHAHRLMIERRNFRLLSDIASKESTLQLVYDVQRLSLFFKAFLFKMDNKKHIINLESFREMLHICPRLPHQPFVEPPFKEEILAFLQFLGHSRAIRRLTDVNINKLHQPWRSFASIINKCLTGKSSGYDSLQLSQAQILWGLYHKRNVNFAYLIREDFIYQVEHKDTKKINEMYYPRNSKAYKEYYAVAIRATPPKPKASVRKTRSSSDTTITPLTAAAGPRLTTSKKGKQAAKASKAKSLSALSEVAMTETQQLKLATKRSLQQTHISQASGFGANKGTGSIPGVLDVPTNESEEEISWNSTDEEGDDKDDEGDDGDDGEEGDDDDEGQDDDDAQDDDDQEDEGNDVDDEEEGSDDEQASDEEEFIHPSLSTHAEKETSDEESFDPIPKTPKNTDDEGNGEENLGTNVGREGHDKEEEEDKLYRDRMNEAVKVAIQIQSDRLKQTVNEQLEVEVLTRSSNSSNTSYVVAVDLSEMELKKILIEKMEGNKSIHRFNEQRNLYKAFVEAYESDKIILDTYGDTVTLKRCRDDDADKDKEPSARSDRGSKRRRKGKEPESASAPHEKATRSASKSTQGSKSRQTSASESATAEEPMQTTFEMEEPSHPEFETSADDQPIVEPSQHPEWFSK